MGVSRSTVLAVAIGGACYFSGASAQSETFGVVESVEGEARVGGAPIVVGQRISSGARVTTALRAGVVLRFDDGMRVALAEQTILRAVDASRSRLVLDLLGGGLRLRTGEVARSNPGQFFLRTTHAQLGIDGPADFAVVVGNGTYVNVAAGTVVAANAAGTSRTAAGATTWIPTSGAAPTAVAPAQLPASVAAAFRAMELPPAPLAADAAPARATPSAAIAPARMYIGVSAGQARFDEGMTSRLITSGTTDTETTGFKLFGGYMFHPNFGVEGGYADLGEAAYSGTFNGTPISGGKLRVNGFDAALVARAQLAQRLTVFGKVGIFAWESEANDTAAGVPFSATTNGSDALFGVGAAYSVTHGAAVRLEAESRKVGDDSVNLFSIGLEFRF